MGYSSKDWQAARGVTIPGPTAARIICRTCGTSWAAPKYPGGRLLRGFWHCPKGCNVPEGVAPGALAGHE
jgi:hypothetical protein